MRLLLHGSLLGKLLHYTESGLPKIQPGQIQVLITGRMNTAELAGMVPLKNWEKCKQTIINQSSLLLYIIYVLLISCHVCKLWSEQHIVFLGYRHCCTHWLKTILAGLTGITVRNIVS